MITKLLQAFTVFSVLITPFFAEARLVQILHTNDTHSFLDNSTHSTSQGGAARLKGLIDEYKKSAMLKGINTIVVDAGDFLEGNTYFMAQRGRKSFQVHNEMGYDISTLGNHDYQIGASELDEMIGEIDLKFSLIVANFDVDEKYKNIKSKTQPFKEIVVDGIKIAFLGLTTDEVFYKWVLLKGAIKDPVKVAKSYEEKLKKRNDFVIALTHIGVLKDIKLAQRTNFIDLIIGGHSHTALFEPVYVSNKLEKKVPIVQAGMHTEYLGRLILDLEKNAPLKIVSYELVPVNLSEDKVDSEMVQLVEESDLELENLYGKEYLNEKIGYSDLKKGESSGKRKWAYLIADGMKEKTGADIAIHAPEMSGANYPIGDITRRKIMNSFPRVFSVDQTQGWDVYTTTIKGTWLRITMTALSYFGQPLTFSGLKMDYVRGPFGFKINKITINGKKINPLKNYKVAFTEGIIKGATGINTRTVGILRRPKNTNIKIWEMLEEKIKRTISIDKIRDENYTTLHPDK